MQRNDSRRKCCRVTPVSSRTSSSKEASAASKVEPAYSSSLTRSRTRVTAPASPVRSRPSSSPLSTTVERPASSLTSRRRSLPTSCGSTCWYKSADLYQHVEPHDVGNDLRLLVSELAGRSTVVLKGEELGLDLTGDAGAVTRVLERVKELEYAGYTFEAADASFELLVREETGVTREHFRLESFRCIVERGDDQRVVAEATVKVWIGDQRVIGTGEGNGPVDALDQAFRAAVGPHFPQLAKVHLADYKVRIIDAGSGTGATTRVLVSSTDGEREWQTVGVSPNIIEASWRAMQDAYDYGLLHAG